jgi:S1-C subfamily serine protease
MSAPRHLWSGSWRLDSAAVAEELAKRRAATEEPTDVPAEPPSPRSGSSTGARIAAWLRTAVRAVRGRRLRVALPIALVGLLTAAAAFAAVSLLARSGGQSPALVSASSGWLGVDMVSFPFGGGTFGSGGGAVVADVSPGSPAAAAGLEPGDVITQIDNQPVASPADVQSAVAGMRAGEQVQIQYDRGPVAYTTQATLQARPSSSP